MTTATGKRQALRERNRIALIEATLESIADRGIADTSVSEIINRAGLSRGMIHLHFGGKDQLVEAAVAHSSDQYYSTLDQMLAQSGQRPQDRIQAIVRSDLGPETLNRINVSIWYAFRGEARKRQSIALHSDTRDMKLRNMILNAFLQITRVEEVEDASVVARDATHGTLALLEGMWTDYLLHPDSFNRDEAARIVFRFLMALFPNHFDLTGAR